MKRKPLNLEARVSQSLLRPLFNQIRSDLNAAKAVPQQAEPEIARKAGSKSIGPGSPPKRSPK